MLVVSCWADVGSGLVEGAGAGGAKATPSADAVCQRLAVDRTKKHPANKELFGECGQVRLVRRASV